MSAKGKNLARIWLFIDFLGLGLSCFLILTYLFYGQRYSLSQTLSEIWIITGFVSLASWICVRVIHNRFKHKRHFSNRRYRVISSFEDFLNNAGNVLMVTPYHNEGYVNKLVKQHKYFRITWQKHKRFFTNSEVKKVQLLMKQQRFILDICQNINQVKSGDEQEVNFLKAELKAHVKSYNESLDHLRFDIRNEA